MTFAFKEAIHTNYMDITRRAEMGAFFCYYYYWYLGQVCPGLERSKR
jgi:hypothetical protein